MSDPFDLESALTERRRSQRYRRRPVLEGPAGREAVVDGRRLLNFCSNDYLGLAAHPAVTGALRRTAGKQAGAEQGAKGPAIFP